MNKNVKNIFFVTMLLVLLLGVGTLSAADISNNTTTVDTTNNVAVTNVQSDTPLKSIATTTSKNIKKDETTTDFYVSDVDGSDENSGTNTSPYKTIQKALNQTNADSTFNIHIAEGTYKGLGNTNLTINGNYNINIIGEGNAVIDGEAKYNIKQELLPGEYFWDSSSQWYPYSNASGNWAMNITSGTGIISLKNIIIQNSWSPGGSNINSYPTSTVDNYGNLIVDNVKFLNNCAGVGGAIRNNHNATITVTNSLFDGNRKSSSSGNDGGAIYNNGTANIKNSIFSDNWSRWGTILNDAKLTITNSTIKNNHEYDGTSTYKYGSGIASDSSQADFFNPYTIEGIETIIDNCIFINNGQTDIWQGNGYLLVNNSYFANSTGIYINANNTTSPQIVSNNQFLNPKSSNIFGSLSVNTETIFGIRMQNSPNLLIENNVFTGTIGNALYINSNAIIKNNTLKTPIQITGNNTSITENNINTTTIYTINIANKTKNHTITNNILESTMLYGNNSVNSTTAIIENNTPNIGNVVNITDETYSDYFDEEGKIIPGTIETKSIVNLNGDFHNKTFIIDNQHLMITATGKLYNSTMTIRDNGQIIGTNIKIQNVNTTDDYALLIETSENLFTGLNINVNSRHPTHGIIIKADNNEIMGSATVYGPSNHVTNENGLTDTMALDIQSSNNIITTGNMQAYSNENNTNGTITAINIQSIDKKANNNTLYNLGARAWYGDNLYAIRIVNSCDNVIFESSTRYSIRSEYALNEAVGIYITGKSNNNQIQKTGYMYISKHDGYSANGWVLTNSNAYAIIVNGSENYKILNTQINNTSSSQILINNTVNTTINNNVIGSIRNFTGVIISNSKNTTLNNIQTTLPDNNVTGILIQNSENTLISNSSLKTDKTIVLNNSVNTTITDNYMNIKDTYGGDETVEIINSTENTIENNTPVIQKLTNDNYYNYFDENHRFNSTYDFIILSSDLYNKDLIIPTKITLLNPLNYTIYNGTLRLIENADGSNITGLNFYSNDERTNIIYSNVSHTYVDYATIYQENHENIVRTIILEELTTYTGLRWSNIHVLGPEIKTKDNTASTIIITRGKGNQKILSLSNITIESTKTDHEGYITLSYSNITGTGSTLNLDSTTINITGNNIIAIDDTRMNTQNMNITINSNNKTTLLKIRDVETLIFRNNRFNINSNNSVTIYNIENNDAFSTDLSNNTMTINSPNIILGNIVNSPGTSSIQGNLTLYADNLILLESYNSKVSLSINITNNINSSNITLINANNSTINAYGNHINATTTNNNGINLINSNATFHTSWPRNAYNEININQTNISPMITILNSTVDIQKTNITQNTSNTPIIKSENSNISVINNYLQTLAVSGDNSVEAINSNSTVENNTPNETGYKSQITDVNIPENIIVKLNNIITITTTDLFGQEINGTITLTDGQTITTSNNNTINYTPQTIGQKTLTITYTDPTGKYDNTSTTINIEVTSPTLIVNPIITKVGDIINITARITADDDTITDINKGKVTFKVNGKTLKDANGKVIYAKVVNGTATIENYEVPEDWAKDGTTIQAVYSGLTQCEKLTSEKINMTVNPKEVTLTTTATQAAPGQTTTLTATLSDDTINTGKIVFKINGKTVKDENGKVIYAKVVNGSVSVDYTLPESYKAGNYTVTATFIASGHDRLEATETLTVTA